MSTFAFNEKPGRTVIVNDEEYLFFSGYSYLGMQHVPEFIALVKEGIDKYGWMFPSSRISNTRLKLYEECEGLLSSITGTEETVLVSSGFTAGRITIEKFKDEIINLQPSHPAITTHTQKKSSDKKVFAVDSVDPLHATITDFSFIENDETSKTIIVDDSHGMGLIGKNGEGITAFLKKNNNTDYIFSYSLSKALNILAGAISCTKAFADELRAMPQYTASAAPSPALMYAFLKGQHLYAAQREQLKKNLIYFHSLINQLTQIHFHPLLPVFILQGFDDEKLLKKKIIISSFAYPDPAGEKLQRVVLNAQHTKDDLEKLAEALHEIYRS
jgi:7-keto-8-aminopelargonate synthetase-like enzyme